MFAKNISHFVALFLFSSLPLKLEAANKSIAMRARFSEVESNYATCDHIFEKQSYDIDFHILNQPRGAVIHFNEVEGFFAESILVARRGYEDLYLEKAMTRGEWPGIKFKVKADGIYDSNLILMDFHVTAQQDSAEDSPVICIAKAQFYATREP